MASRFTCWKYFDCTQKNCPAHRPDSVECWLVSDTNCHTHLKVDSSIVDKIEMCLQCEAFRENLDRETMETTLLAAASRLNETRRQIEERDRELESISLEMALGLSEVFEALKQISSGDPTVVIPETSSQELISKLKQMVNRTARNLGEIVDLSHEFAIGLAEHFDVLHRVSTGDLSAQVTGTSPVDLLESLKQITNSMIHSVAATIAEREQAQTELSRSEERFRMFAEKAPIGITIMEADGQFSYINPMFRDIFGYTRDDIPDKQTWFKKAYPDEAYRDMVVNTWQQYGKTPSSIGEVKPRTLTVRCNMGQDKIINFRTVVLQDGKHFVTYSDVTEHARAEDAIAESEKKYRTLVDNIQDGIFIIQDDKLQFVNGALAEMLGYTPVEMIGTTFMQYVAPEDRAMVVDRYQRRIAGEEIPGEYEYRMLHQDGVSRKLVKLSVALFTFQGREATIGTVKDITEKRLAEIERRKLEDQLRRSQKMEAIGTLAGGVAHDLNNILSGIVSYPQLLLLDLPEESPMYKPILTIQKSGERAATIVQDLLTLARRGVTAFEVIDFNQIVNEYLRSPEFDRLKSFHPNIEIETELQPGLLQINGSAVHLSKTVMNLVSNAAEAMPAGGRISLSTENCYVDLPIKGYDEVKQGDYVVFKVTDTGVGISHADMERIFEPFYTKKVMGRSGTGLGMAVVWGTVKDHKGYIDAHSIEGQGSSFSLYLPVTREALPVQKEKPTLEDLMGHGETIAVIDDVEDQRTIASGMLTKLGYQVTTFAGGEPVLVYLQEHTVDLVLLDMIMDPGIDGLDTYKQIIAIHPGQKAVIASGFSETDRVKETQRLGAGGYVKKPYTIEKIGLAVKKELAR